jgi:hypothetical protein
VTTGRYLIRDVLTRQLEKQPPVVRGPQGEEGPPGQSGPQGPRGAAGKAGIALDGVTGPVGPIGPIGPTGVTGPKGDTGETGPSGAQGFTGPPGPAGGGRKDDALNAWAFQSAAFNLIDHGTPLGTVTTLDFEGPGVTVSRVAPGAGTATITGGGGGSGTALEDTIAQTGHVLAVGDIVRFDGANYVVAQADSAANAEVVGIVSAVADADHFTLTTSGLIDGLAGLTAGEVYFLSEVTPGLLTTTEPTGVGEVSKPVLIAISTTSGYLTNFRGSVIAVPIAASDVTVDPTVADAADVQAALETLAITAIVSETEPSPKRSGMIWVRTYPTNLLSAPPPYPAYVCDSLGDWLEIGQAHFDGNGVLRSLVQTVDDSVTIAYYDASGVLRAYIPIATSGIDLWMYDDAANLRTMLNINGGTHPDIEGVIRNASGDTMAAFTVAGDADGGIQLQIGDGSDNILTFKDNGLKIISTGIGFFGTAPTGQPIVPLTSPTIQNVIDALTSIGLVLQSD